MMWGYGAWGFIFMALFWLGVVALIVWGVKYASDTKVRPGAPTRAVEILEQRYARGEMDTDEFQERRSQLES